MAINWAKNIDRLNSKEGNPPEGKDWFTAKEFQENSSYGRGKSYEQLKKAIADNIVEVHRGSSWDSNLNQCTRKVWYRFINRK
jgi:hypothetical protein